MTLYCSPDYLTSFESIGLWVQKKKFNIDLIFEMAARVIQNMEAADREGLQRVEALGYQPSWQKYVEIWCEICHVCISQLSGRGPTDVDVAPVPAR